MPACYRWIKRRNPDAVLLEAPMVSAGAPHMLSASCAYWQSHHRLTTTAGYSGIGNRAFDEFWRVLDAPLAMLTLSNGSALEHPENATFGAIGNVQKFPSRVSTNTIYRTVQNPVLKDPHPHPAYVEAIAKVDAAAGGDAEVKAAYDNLNRVLVDEAFAVPTNSYDVGLIVASEKIGGITLDMDNLFVARTIGFK